MTVDEKVESRGYWTFVYRPMPFVPDRVPYEQLVSVIDRSSVIIRGWDVPHIDSPSEILRSDHWVGEECDWEHHVETWRFFESGQFALKKGIRLEWRDQSSWFDDANLPDRRLLGVSDTVGHFTEVMTLAARLAVSPAGADAIEIDATAHNIEGMQLYTDSPRRGQLRSSHVTNASVVSFRREVSREDLVARYQELAFDASAALMLRFGFQAAPSVLQSLRDEFR